MVHQFTDEDPKEQRIEFLEKAFNQSFNFVILSGELYRDM